MQHSAANLTKYAAASKKYDREILGPRFTEEGFNAIPANERKGCPGDHWYELPLSCKKACEDIGMCMKGHLFTTCMPRPVDDKWPAKDVADKYPAWLTDSKEEDPNAKREKFKSNVFQYGIKNVVALVEDKELNAGDSNRLWEYYEALGLNVVRAPTNDFNCPHTDSFKKVVAWISLALANGNSTLVHCWGGSGRTGTYVIGILKNLGIKEPIGWARQIGKSVYLDVAEQEQFLTQMQIVLTPQMFEENPALVLQMVLNHMKNLFVFGASEFEPAEGFDDDIAKLLDAMFDDHSTIIQRQAKMFLTKQMFLKMMTRVAKITAQPELLTAKDRAHMPVGDGKIGSFPLPAGQCNPEQRAPTPLGRAGDYWSNTLHGSCVIVGDKKESMLWN